MANQKNALTATNIKYLLVMYRLYTSHNTIRCVKIAQELHVTKPSVHTMINTLMAMGLVNKNLYGEVFFTEEGQKLAEKYNGYYQIVSNMLRTCLSDEGDIRNASCAVLAEVSGEGLAQLCDSISSRMKEGLL